MKNIAKINFIIILYILFLISIPCIKKFYLKKHLIRKFFTENEIYKLSNNIIRINEDGIDFLNKEEIQNKFKLLFEINFDCFICLEDLKKIYKFYIELSNKKNDVIFLLITTEKSLKYIKSCIDTSINNYDLLIIQQESKDDNVNLYLLDKKNNILIAGDITKFPFLRREYIRRLTSSLK